MTVSDVGIDDGGAAAVERDAASEGSRRSAMDVASVEDQIMRRLFQPGLSRSGITELDEIDRVRSRAELDADEAIMVSFSRSGSPGQRSQHRARVCRYQFR